MKKLIGSIFIFTFIIYLITSAGNTPYDYFIRLADAFLHARYWLTENPPWLSELIPAGENKFYVVYPPMPALLSLPFVLVFGKNFPQQYLAHLVGAGIVVASFLLALIISHKKTVALYAAMLIGFGSIVWFLSSAGSSWYIGETTAAFFLLLALLEGFGRKRSFVVGVLLGAACLARLQAILFFPLFLFLIRRRLHFLLGLGIFVMIYAGYNLARFGNLLETGYGLIPGVLGEPWYEKGLFHLSYIPRHLEVVFFALPKIINDQPYIVPSWSGMAIWVTTPAFIFSLFAPLKERVVPLTWLSVSAITLAIFLHGTTGFAQFGYRFAVPLYPFLLLLTVKGLGTHLRWYHWALLVVSIVVNLWGVLWINKFGWVSF